MHTDPTNASDRRLWEMVSRPSPVRSGLCPDSLELAAYADGRLDESRHAAVEGHLADCADCREAIAVARAVAENAAVLVAPDVVEAARRLVAPAAPLIETVSRRHRLAVISRWTAAAAASVAVCLVGYQAGTVSAPTAPAGPDVLDDMTFGVFDGMSSEGWDLLSFAEPEDAG